jgi:hypothetical protein
MRHVSSIQGVCMLGALALLSLGSAGCLKDVGLAGTEPSSGAGTVTEGTGGCSGTTGPGMIITTCPGNSVGVGTGSGMVGIGGGPPGGMTTGVGGSPGGMTTGTGMMGGTGGVHGGSSAVSTGAGMTTGVGSSSGGMSTGTGFGVGGSAGMSTGTGVMTGTGGGSFGSATSTSASGGMTSSTSSGSTAACQLGPTPIPCDFAHLNADCAPYGAVCDYVFSQCSCCFVHDDLSCSQDADCQSSFGADAYCSAGTCGCK